MQQFPTDHPCNGCAAQPKDHAILCPALGVIASGRHKRITRMDPATAFDTLHGLDAAQRNRRTVIDLRSARYTGAELLQSWALTTIQDPDTGRVLETHPHAVTGVPKLTGGASVRLRANSVSTRAVASGDAAAATRQTHGRATRAQRQRRGLTSGDRPGQSLR